VFAFFDLAKPAEFFAQFFLTKSESEATIAQLKKEMGSVVARLKDQESKIQKVSDQLELRKPAPQMVLNNQ